MYGLKSKYYRRKNNGFSLIEVTLAIIIVGVAVVSMLMLFAAETQVNEFSNHMSSGVFLAEQLQAITDQRSFDDLLTLDGLTYNQAVDADENSLVGLENFRQQLSVQIVNPADLTLYVGPDPHAVLLTAIVDHRGSEVMRISWLRTK